MALRVVFDTNTVVSALLFENGRLAWLRQRWQSDDCTALASRETIAEMTRLFAYPKFKLSVEDRHELLAEYLPFCEIVGGISISRVICRDAADQKYLDLAESGNADLLVTGDADLLVLVDQVRFAIETPAKYWTRIMPHPPGEF